MPRQAHGRSLTASGPSRTRKRKPAKGRGLNALEVAEKQFPDKIKIRQHRLGEAEDEEDLPQSHADLDERSSKRRKIDGRNNEDVSSADEGSDLDGDRWHVGVDDEDEDSEIDSDEAFGESDEERFAGFTFRGSSQNQQSQKGRKRERGLHLVSKHEEDSDESVGSPDIEDQDDLGDDAVDLAAALDMNEEEERKTLQRVHKSQKRTARSPSTEGSDDSDTSDIQSQDQDLSDDFSAFSLSEDEANIETANKLRKFVEGLAPSEQNDKRIRRAARSRNLPSKPSQFALPSTGLSAEDLMQYVKDPTQRQSLKILRAAENEDPTQQKGKIPGKLAAPLAKRQRDRLDRVAAYDQGKQTMERWVDTVKGNRRAEHISYPLADAAKDSAGNAKTFQPLDKGEVRSELESKIEEIMRESGLETGNARAEEDEQQRYEELQEKNIPLEEVQARRRELRLQRELMFREEIRAKRIKKIKSKAFRRVHRKERDKFAVQERERLVAAGMLNSDEEREQNDRRRAEERMGARHRESKWAKAAKATGQTTWNEDAKMGVSELARRDEELRRRIDGRTVRDSNETASESDSDSDEDLASEDGTARWDQKLRDMEATSVPSGRSKLSEMAFMKKADAARKSQNDQEVRLLRQALGEDGDTESQDGSDVDEKPIRQKFGSSKSKQALQMGRSVERDEFEAPLSDDEEDNDVRKTNENDDQANVQRTSSGTAKRATGRGVLANGLGFSQTGEQSISRQASGTVRPGEVAKEVRKPRKKSNKTWQSALDDYTSPSGSESEVNGHKPADQSKLALDIFAGDDEEDLREQFQKEKRQTIEKEGDQVVDNTLPGWGSWTGAGISRREQKKGKGQVLSKIKGVAPEVRKDARLDRVIVNEKRVKKSGKYLAEELPHMFESRQQYERALRLPMGPEWSTRNHFQDAIKPRVLLKQGQIIKPMAKPKV